MYLVYHSSMPSSLLGKSLIFCRMPMTSKVCWCQSLLGSGGIRYFGNRLMISARLVGKIWWVCFLPFFGAGCNKNYYTEQTIVRFKLLEIQCRSSFRFASIETQKKKFCHKKEHYKKKFLKFCFRIIFWRRIFIFNFLKNGKLFIKIHRSKTWIVYNMVGDQMH